MASQRIVGVVLVAVGLTLALIGFNSSQSIADQLSSTFTGRFTQATTWFMIGGAGLGLLGLLMTVARVGKTS